MKGRVFVIGDVHGGYRGLIQVLQKSNFDYENDTLICLGDVTDGWSETAEAIEELMKIKNLIYIKGNHDEWTERFLEFTMENGERMISQSWIRQGGKETYDSYKKHPELVGKHVEFLKNAKLYHIDDKNRLFIHAGFNPIFDLENQPHMDVGQIDDNSAIYYWDRGLWRDVCDQYKIGNVEVELKPYKEVYIGHTPTTRRFPDGNPVNIGNLWNMDTGAAYDGCISMMDLETKEVYQSEKLYRLYPDEMGRNKCHLMFERNEN